MKNIFLLIAFSIVGDYAAERKKYKFNSDWRLQVEDFPQAKQSEFKDDDWEQVTLPRAFNEESSALVLITAGLDTRVITGVANHPILSDMTEYKTGRAGGYPHFFV